MPPSTSSGWPKCSAPFRPTVEMPRVRLLAPKSTTRDPAHVAERPVSAAAVDDSLYCVDPTARSPLSAAKTAAAAEVGLQRHDSWNRRASANMIAMNVSWCVKPQSATAAAVTIDRINE